MKIDLTGLNNKSYTKIEVDEVLKVSNEDAEKLGVTEFKDFTVKGFISSESNNIRVVLEINGEFIIPCSISLEPTTIPGNLKIDCYLDEIEEEFDKKLKINENTLDIFPIVWENVLVEIPMKVVNPKAKAFDEEKYNNKNSEFEKLKELL